MRTLATTVDGGRCRWSADESSPQLDDDRRPGCCTRCCTLTLAELPLIRRSGLPTRVIRSKRGCMPMCACGRGWPLLLLSPLLSVASGGLCSSVHEPVARPQVLLQPVARSWLACALSPAGTGPARTAWDSACAYTSRAPGSKQLPPQSPSRADSGEIRALSCLQVLILGLILAATFSAGSLALVTLTPSKHDHNPRTFSLPSRGVEVVEGR